ncbi:MAG TPA: dephospho-CoA kinase [Candidatus Blautia faecavium]|uniref:Dephospho-CoA kinase n=1 Tax=Candidatus Blautia faecavium TaxID=2838487 RepID=A0A9D2LSC7_9FIRM|nr:dephospho-CoA kinase [Candidatus Blautia faecavium]
MKTIGITGGVGAGKSTVLSYLEEKYHAFVLQADLVGHKVMEPGERCYEPVVALFGKNVLKEDKTIDRRKVSDVVFSHEELLQELEHIIHPAVKEYILEQLSEKEKKGQSLCVVEAALLLEENYQAFCDQVWYIHTDKEIRMERLAMSRGYTREKAQSIIDSQASEEYFRSHADYIIENNGDLKRTYKQIIEGIERL